MQHSEADSSNRGVSEIQGLAGILMLPCFLSACTEVYNNPRSTFALLESGVIRPVEQQHSPQVVNDEQMTRQKT